MVNSVLFDNPCYGKKVAFLLFNFFKFGFNCELSGACVHVCVRVCRSLPASASPWIPGNAGHRCVGWGGGVLIALLRDLVRQEGLRR